MIHSLVRKPGAVFYDLGFFPSLHGSQCQEVRPEDRILLVVVTADRGLCGAFNTNIAREVQKFVRERPGPDIRLMAVGRKGRDYFRRREATIIEEHIGIFSQLDFKHARAIGDRIVELYSGAEIDSVYLAYNEFKSVIQ